MNKKNYVFIIMLLHFLCFPLTGFAGEVKDATNTETETHLPFLQANMISPTNSQNHIDLEQMLLAASEASCLNTCTSLKTTCLNAADSKCGSDSSCLQEEQTICESNYNNCVVWANSSTQCGHEEVAE